MSGSYDWTLVLASYCVAVLASYAALDLGGRIAFFEGRRQRFWLLAGALAMGTGIWTVHFVGMKAFSLPLAITYDLGLTLLSWVAAIGVSLLALSIISRSQLTTGGIALGALVMGLGICIMHYSGMWAMRMSPGISYEPLLLSASAAIAVLASAAALFLCFNIRRLPDGAVVPAKLAAALLMGATICGMHYTGMAAARFPAGALCAPGNMLGGDWTGLPVALAGGTLVIAIVLLSLTDANTLTERRRVEQERLDAEHLRRLARYDSVTGLPNRTLFNETLHEQLAPAHGRTPAAFGLLYCEMRSYRALCNHFGQPRMDEIMNGLGAQLAQLLKPDDMLARLSHDSFALMLRDRPGRSLAVAANALAVTLSVPVYEHNEPFQFTWGIGMSHHPEQGASAQGLMRAAQRPQRMVGGELERAPAAARPAYGRA
jgi:diguanylate cyclase (GGDEF)-like protein